MSKNKPKLPKPAAAPKIGYYVLKLQVTASDINEKLEAVRMFFERYLWLNRYGISDFLETSPQDVTYIYLIANDADIKAACCKELDRLLELFNIGRAATTETMQVADHDISKRLDKLKNSKLFSWTSSKD